MDGPLYHEREADREKSAARKQYIEVVKEMERVRHLDSKLSMALSDETTQALASAIWLYRDGRVGFYSKTSE
jgi:hypothetical protein